jgi:CDP-4-dehydro-6-deoxyglucose reductase
MKKIRLAPSPQMVECQEGDTVLAALERAGYALPNNCRAGACGECKIRVLSGSFDQGFVLDMALSQEERRAGFGLMCMAKPISEELVIEWGSVQAKPRLFPPQQDMPFVVTDRIERTPVILEFRLRPIGTPMRFWPGQYVTLRKPGTRLPRAYSIASAPRPDGEITLQVTRQEGGETSAWLHESVQTGDLVPVSGPFGTFIGDPSVDTPVLCLAAGSGLAPILSLTEAALRRGYSAPVTLLFSAKRLSDIYCRGLIGFWQQRYRNFRFVATLTREQRPGFEHGRIPDLLARQFADLARFSVFIAGSTGFVAECLAAVRRCGAPADRIHTEGFVAVGGASDRPPDPQGPNPA